MKGPVLISPGNDSVYGEEKNITFKWGADLSFITVLFINQILYVGENPKAPEINPAYREVFTSPPSGAVSTVDKSPFGMSLSPGKTYYCRIGVEVPKKNNPTDKTFILLSNVQKFTVAPGAQKKDGKATSLVELNTDKPSYQQDTPTKHHGTVNFEVRLTNTTNGTISLMGLPIHSDNQEPKLSKNPVFPYIYRVEGARHSDAFTFRMYEGDDLTLKTELAPGESKRVVFPWVKRTYLADPRKDPARAHTLNFKPVPPGDYYAEFGYFIGMEGSQKPVPVMGSTRFSIRAGG